MLENASEMEEGTTPGTKGDLIALEDRLIEFMRTLETNMLTAFHGYGKGQQARLHDVETSEHAMKVRSAALEDRVLDLETRNRRQN